MKKILLSLTLLIVVLTNILFANVFAMYTNNSDETILLKYYNVFNNSQYSKYALYDVDKNGFPELILSTDLNNKFSECHIYTYTNNKIVDLGTHYIGYGIYGIDENGIVISTGGTGVLVYSKLYIENDMLKEDKTTYLSLCVQPHFEEYLYKGDKISGNQFTELENRLLAIEFNDIFKLQNSIKVILNGTEFVFDQPPIIENDRVMVPIRAIFEAFGYNLEWNQDTQTAIATKGNNKLSVPEGLSGLYVDDEWLSFDVPNINISGRILVPVRVVAECAGAEVEWDGKNQSVIIDYDSITADKRVSILKYILSFDNYMKNIFTTEKYTYQTFYKDMYIDNIYSGMAVDLVAEYFVDENLDKDKYIDVITTLLNMADFTIEDNIEKQHEFDTYKTFGEYAWDVGEILIGTISPEGNKKLEIIKDLIDADSEAINITVDSIEKYERLNKIQLETEYKMNILDILEEGSFNENLTVACQEIRDAEKKKVLLELDILNEGLTDVAEYLTNDVLFKQMAFPLMKQSDAYANNETLKLIVDKGDDLYKKADDCFGALKTGFKLGLFAGDMILGTTNTINRVTEMKALAIIRLSFGSNLSSQLTNPLDSSKDVDEAYEELINIIPLIKFIDNIHLRGEYCMYKLMSEDQQLFSLIYDLSGDNLENLNKWWNNTKNELIWYDHKLSSICQ